MSRPGARGRWIGRVALAWGLACLSVSGAAAAGPFGGSVTSLVLDGLGRSPAWVGTERGLFRFEGGRWLRVSFWETRHVTALARAGDAVLAAEHRNGLWRSADHGATWERVQEGLQTPTATRVREVLCLVTDPADGRRVYLGSAGQGLFESRNGGRTWTRLDEGLEAQSPPAFHVTAILPSEGARPLLMGTDGAGLFSWTAEGWQAVGGLPPALRVRAIAAEPGRPEHLLLATRGFGLWESRDAGGTWRRVRKGFYGMVEAVAVAPGGGWLALFAGEGLVASGKPRPRVLGVWKTAEVRVLLPADKGWFAGVVHDGTWRLAPDGTPQRSENEGMDATTVLSLLREPDGILWCGDTNGVFRSDDGGKTWIAQDRGLPGASVNVLLRAGASLYAGTGGRGVFRWLPEAGRWEDVSQGLGTANTIFSLTWDGEALYAGTEGGIVRRGPKGPWEHVSEGLPAAGRWVVAADPARPGRVWAAGGGAVYRSEDGGTAWERAAGGEAVALHVTPGRGEVWMLEPRGLRQLDVGAGVPAVPLERGEQFSSWGWDGDRIWLGTSRGLWVWGPAGVRRVWQGGRVTSVWAEAGGGFLGTDGLGVQRLPSGGS